MALRLLILVLLVACGSKGERAATKNEATKTEVPVPARAYAPDAPLPEGATRRLGGTRFRVADRVWSFAVSPDGAYVALGGGDNRIGVWSTATGAQVFEGGEKSAFDRISAIAFAKDALVFASGNKPIRVISTKTWALVEELDTCQKEWVVDLAASPDGTRIAVSCEDIGEVRLQPIGGGGVVKIFDVKRPERFAWSHDGAWLATTSVANGNLLVIDVAKRTIARRVETNSSSRPDAIAFSPTSTVLAWSDDRKYMHERVRLWDVVADKDVGEFEVALGATAIAFSSDGQTLAYGQESGVHTLAVVNLATKTRRELMRPKQAVEGLAFAGKELWVATDHAVRAWDVVNDVELAGPDGHRGAVLSLAFRPDGKALASGGGDDAARVWDLATGTSRELALVTDEYGVIMIDTLADWLKWPMSAVFVVTWSPDGKRLYTASGGHTGQGVLRRWVGEKLDGAWPLQDLHTHAFALAPDESVAYSIGATHDGGDTMRITRLSDGQIARKLPSEHEELLALSPDGKWLAREHEEGIEIIHAMTGAVKARGLPGGVLAFSHDSTRLAVGGDGGYQVFRVGETTAEHEGYTANGKVTSMAFTPDGRLVLGHHRGHVAVVRPGSDELVVRPSAHRGIVHAVAVAPDGKSFASGAEDGQILLWPL